MRHWRVVIHVVVGSKLMAQPRTSANHLGGHDGEEITLDVASVEPPPSVQKPLTFVEVAVS